MELEVDKKYSKSKPKINRVEIEYKDMNYIIANFAEKVIDINGDIYEYTISDEQLDDLEKMIWNYAYLNRGLSIVLNSKRFISKNGLLDLINNNIGNDALYEPIHLENSLVG